MERKERSSWDGIKNWKKGKKFMEWKKRNLWNGR
jgi:hypothetical protein